MTRTFSTLAVACVLASVFAVATFADELVFFSPIWGSNPGLTIAGVASGGAPWVIERGFGVLTDGGRLRVEVRRLVLPVANNTAGPVTAVSASVVCSDTVAATTSAFALSTEGNANIHGKLKLPAPCLGAIILVRAAALNGTAVANGPWIAATGVDKGRDQDTDDDKDN
jgi:hypothetical protein